MLTWNGAGGVRPAATISFPAAFDAPAVRSHSFSAADAIAVIVLVAAVAMVTRLITLIQGRSALQEGIFEQGPPLAVMDVAHRVVRINREFTHLFGIEQQDAFGRLLGELIVPEESREEFRQKMDQVAQGKRVDGEAVRMRKDGTRLHVLVVTMPVKASDGQISVYALYRDITQRKAAETALQALSQRLLEVQEAERKHLARELHDEIGQSLTGLRLLLRQAGGSQADSFQERLDQARGLTDELLARVRALSFDLRPADLDRLGLLPALLAHFERYTPQTGVSIFFKHQGIEERFPSQVETSAYRTVQEALTNVARHAGVANATVRVWAETGRLNVQVEDLGSGFDPEAAAANPLSSGLTGMRERIFLVGGRVSVESAPGCGTTITVELPLDDRKLTS